MTNLLTPITDFHPKRTSSFPGVPVAEPDPAATNRRVLNSVEDMLATRCADMDQPHEQPTAETQRPAARPAPRVLCIDDDPEYIHALQIRLESRGIAVLRATTGLDGFCYAVGEPADAILLDYQLPNGCGDYILEQLKANPATQGIPVIVISGSKDRALEYTLVNGGAVRFMHKPLDFEDLMSELRKHLAV
jgi:two-component system, OmpR family, response regulator RpaA